ncbi:hypothetical protein D3C75_1200920 [compost metagenome]
MAPAPLMNRCVSVEPVPVPALRPTVYGVVLLQVTERLVLPVTAVFSTPWLPKLRSVAEMTQLAVMVSVTLKLAVAV